MHSHVELISTSLSVRNTWALTRVHFLTFNEKDGVILHTISSTILHKLPVLLVVVLSGRAGTAGMLHVWLEAVQDSRGQGA